MLQETFMKIIKKMGLPKEAVYTIDLLSSELINYAYDDGWNDAVKSGKLSADSLAELKEGVE